MPVDKEKALLDYRRAYFDAGRWPEKSAAFVEARNTLDSLGVPVEERNQALWRGHPDENS